MPVHSLLASSRERTDDPTEEVSARRASHLVRLISIGLCGLGVLALIFWAFYWWGGDRRFFVWLMPVPPALMSVVLGAACFLALRRAPGRQLASRAAAFSALVLLIGTMVLEAGITEPWNVTQWNRTSPDSAITATALAFCILLRGEGSVRSLFVQIVGSVVLVTKTVELVGRAFGAAQMYTLGNLGPVPSALLTLVSLWFLALAVLCLPPLHGPMAIALSPRLGGVAFRWVVLLLVVLPLNSRAVLVLLDRGAISEQTAMALASILNVLACVSLVLWLGRELNRADFELERTRRGLVASRDWLALIIEQLPEGVILVDAAGRVSLFNGSAGRLLPQLRLRRLFEAAFSERPDAFAQLCGPLDRVLRDAESTVGLELGLQGPSSSEVALLVSLAPLLDTNNARGAVIVLQDVTRFKDYERGREEWIAVVAHDLRQPISVISLSAQQLRRGTSDRTRHERLLARIEVLAGELGHMVEDLLDASRIEARQMELKRTHTELTARLREILQAMEDVTPRHELIVRVRQSPLWVLADVPRLRQILGNLLSNAEKYGEEDGPIIVSAERHAEEAVVTVSNRGEPLPKHELDRLFARFARADTPATARTPGIGLGLYITRGLVEAHGGRVWAESDERQTRISFSLPLAEAPLEAPPVVLPPH